MKDQKETLGANGLPVENDSPRLGKDQFLLEVTRISNLKNSYGQYAYRVSETKKAKGAKLGGPSKDCIFSYNKVGEYQTPYDAVCELRLAESGEKFINIVDGKSITMNEKIEQMGAMAAFAQKNGLQVQAMSITELMSLVK